MTQQSAFFRTDGVPPLGHVRHHADLPYSAWSHIQPVKYWQGIPAFDPPARRRDYELLADMTERMVATRQRRLAAMEPKDLGRIAAVAELAMFEHMAHGWAFICNRTGTAPDPLAAPEPKALQDALDAALRTIAALATQKNDLSGELAEQAECVIALRWWAEPALRLRPKSEITTTAKEGELA